MWLRDFLILETMNKKNFYLKQLLVLACGILVAAGLFAIITPENIKLANKPLHPPLPQVEEFNLEDETEEDESDSKKLTYPEGYKAMVKLSFRNFNS